MQASSLQTLSTCSSSPLNSSIMIHQPFFFSSALTRSAVSSLCPSSIPPFPVLIPASVYFLASAAAAVREQNSSQRKEGERSAEWLSAEHRSSLSSIDHVLVTEPSRDGSMSSLVCLQVPIFMILLNSDRLTKKQNPEITASAECW